MGKVVNYYIEKVFNVNAPNRSKNFIETAMVNNIDPLMIEKEKDLIGFRFYNVDEKGEKTNYSSMYYFGERVTFKDLMLVDKDNLIRQMQRDYLSRRGIEEAIFCDNANRIIYDISPEDKTIDEVKIERITKQARTFFLNQKDFLNEIIVLLEKYGNDIDIVMLERYYPIADAITGDDIDDMYSIIRTYDLYVNKYKVLSSSAVINRNSMGLENIDTYIRLSDALELVMPLYQEYPYLEGIINSFILEFSNKGESLINSIKCREKSIK